MIFGKGKSGENGNFLRFSGRYSIFPIAKRHATQHVRQVSSRRVERAPTHPVRTSRLAWGSPQSADFGAKFARPSLGRAASDRDGISFVRVANWAGTKGAGETGASGEARLPGGSPPGSQKFEITFPHPTRAPETIRYGRKHRRPASPRRRGQIRKGSRETEVWKKNFFSILQLDAAVKYRWNVRPIGVRGNDAAVERMQTFQTARENTHKRPSSEQKRELTHTERRYAWSA